MGRKKAVLLVGILSWLVSFLPSLGYSVLSWVEILGFNILDFMDFITNAVLMPICSLLTCLFVSIGIGVKVIEQEVCISGEFKRRRLFDVMIKYIAPVFVCAILISSVLEAFGVIAF